LLFSRRSPQVAHGQTDEISFSMEILVVPLLVLTDEQGEHGSEEHENERLHEPDE
jgi:hypothetical protein